MANSETRRSDEPDLRASRGESMPTPGMNTLDQVRESSMSNEGGASGAVMESQDEDTLRSPTSRRPCANASALAVSPASRRTRRLYLVVPAALVALAAGFALARRS